MRRNYNLYRKSDLSIVPKKVVMIREGRDKHKMVSIIQSIGGTRGNENYGTSEDRNR